MYVLARRQLTGLDPFEERLDEVQRLRPSISTVEDGRDVRAAAPDPPGDPRLRKLLLLDAPVRGTDSFEVRVPRCGSPHHSERDLEWG